MTSPRASASGLPISMVISSAKSSARSVTSSKARRRISPTLARRNLCPGLLCSGRSVQGRGTVFGAGVGNAQQHLAGGGILDVERLAGSGITPLAIDQQTGGNGGQKPAFTVGGNSGLCSNSHDDSLVSRVVAAVVSCRSGGASEAD